MRKLALILLLQATAGSLAAQAAAPSPTPGHARAAEELLLLFGMNDPMTNAAPMFEAIKRQFPANPAAMDVAKEFMDKYVKWEDVKPELIAAYTEAFSERELRDLLAFYKTPIGAKFRTAMPTIAAKTMTIYQSRLQPHMMELGEAIMKRVPPG